MLILLDELLQTLPPLAFPLILMFLMYSLINLCLALKLPKILGWIILSPVYLCYCVEKGKTTKNRRKLIEDLNYEIVHLKGIIKEFQEDKIRYRCLNEKHR